LSVPQDGLARKKKEKFGSTGSYRLKA